MTHQGGCAVCGIVGELHAPPELNGLCAPCHMAALEGVVPMTDQISAWTAANALALPLRLPDRCQEHGEDLPCLACKRAAGGELSFADVAGNLYEARTRETDKEIMRLMLGSALAGTVGSAAQAQVERRHLEHELEASRLLFREHMRSAMARAQVGYDWARYVELFGVPMHEPFRLFGSSPGTKYNARRKLYWRRKANRLRARCGA